MLLVFFGFCGFQEQQQEQQEEQKQEHEERKKETRQGGTDISSTVINNDIFIVSFIFPVVCPPSLFHSKGRANANNTWKKATIAMQKLQTTLFQRKHCVNQQRQKQTHTNNDEQHGTHCGGRRCALPPRPPPAPPTRLF